MNGASRSAATAPSGARPRARAPSGTGRPRPRRRRAWLPTAAHSSRPGWSPTTRRGARRSRAATSGSPAPPPHRHAALAAKYVAAVGRRMLRYCGSRTPDVAIPAAAKCCSYCGSIMSCVAPKPCTSTTAGCGPGAGRQREPGRASGAAGEKVDPIGSGWSSACRSPHKYGVRMATLLHVRCTCQGR